MDHKWRLDLSLPKGFGRVKVFTWANIVFVCGNCWYICVFVWLLTSYETRRKQNLSEVKGYESILGFKCDYVIVS